MFLPSATGFLWPGFCYSHSTLVGDVLKHLQCRQTASELLPVRGWWLGGNCIACLSTELCSWLQQCWLAINPLWHAASVALVDVTLCHVWSLSGSRSALSLYGCPFTVIDSRFSLGCLYHYADYWFHACVCLSVNISTSGLLGNWFA